MMDCISVETMRLSDADTIARVTPGLTLMHRAAMGVFLAVNWSGKIAIVTGSGNNGGDGYALGCILKEKGYDCRVFTAGSRLSPDSAHYAAKAKDLGIPILPMKEGALGGFDMVVDCLLGTGFLGQLREHYRAAIEAINESNARIVSVDINSGMNGDTGEAELAVKSDLTVTIGYVKNGLVTEKAGRYMKKLVCADIGIGLIRQENRILSEAEWAGMGFPSGSRREERQGVLFFRCPAWLDMDRITVK